MLDVPVTPARGPAPTAVRRLSPLVLLGLIYLAASVALHHRVLATPTSTAIGSGTTDHNLFLWWLNWTPWSILHGQNPLFTDFQHYPLGVNAMWNTSVPLLGVLLAPVTLTAGPLAAFNVGVVLGPAVSGVAMAAALGPYVRAWVPRAVAGALYAFAPFHLAHASVAHLNLVWSLLPPALLYLTHVLFVRQLTRPVLVGAAGGAAFAAQTLLYPQTVATGVLMLVVTGAVLAVGWPRRVRPALPGLVRAGLACVGTYAALCAYPLYLLLAGPVRPQGRIRDPEIDRADAANVLVPTRLTAVRPVPDGLTEQMHGQVGEQGGYVGVAMLVLLVVAVVSMRSAAVRVAAVLGVVAFALSLGPSLVVLGTDTEVPLPWRAVMAVPLVGEAEPVRMQVYVALCVAVIVAVWLDRLPGLRVPARAMAVAVTAAALVSWLPADAQPTQEATAPAFFATAGRHLAPTDVVETYPRLTNAWEDGASPLRWQVASGMAYRTTGGYFIGSDADNPVLFESRLTAYQIGCRDIADRGGRPGDDLAALAHRELVGSGTTVVLVVPPVSGDLTAILEWTRRATGDAGRRVDDVWLFRV